MKSKPVIMLCTWMEFDLSKGKWLPEDDDPPVPCRGLLGAKKVTTWLPKGSKIQNRRSRNERIPIIGYKFIHWYGFERSLLDKHRIDMRLVLDLRQIKL